MKARGFLDFETWHWTNPFFVGYLWKREGEAKHRWGFEHDAGPQTYESSRVLMKKSLLLVAAIAERENVYEWWAHNGGKFDWMAMLEAGTLHLNWEMTMKPRGSGIIEMLVWPGSKEKKPLRFYDSMAVVNTSLKQAALDFQLQHSKLLTDEDYLADPRTWSFQRLHDGCQLDCLVGLELLEKVEEMAEGFGGSLKSTFSQIALAAMKQHLKENNDEILDHTKDTNYIRFQNWCEDAYHGGRVEVYHHCPPTLVDVYDINSSYPYAMTGWLPWTLKGKGQCLTQRAVEKLLWSPGEREGIIEARVIVPQMQFPPLPYIDEFGSIMFPTGEWRGKFAANELRYAMQLGVQVFPEAGICYNAARPFQSYIPRLFDLKAKAKKDGETAKETFIKFITNGGYGKLGQDDENERIKVWQNASDGERIVRAELLKMAEAKKRGFVYESNVGTLGDPRFMVFTSSNLVKHAHFAAAAYITADARIRYHMALTPDTYYGDTDSRHACTGTRPDNVGAGLGQWKLEAEKLRAAYLAPKVYWTAKPWWDGKSAHACNKACKKDCRKGGYEPKAKGFPLKQRNPKTGELEWDVDAMRDLQGGLPVAAPRIASAKSQLRGGGTFKRLTGSRRWAGHSTKRRPLEDGSTVPWDVKEIQREEHLEAMSPVFRQGKTSPH